MMESDPLRDEIKRMKKQKLIKLNELADSAGISRPHLSNFLSGGRDFSPEVKASVQKALKSIASVREDKASVMAKYTDFLYALVDGLDFRWMFEDYPVQELVEVEVRKIFVEPSFQTVSTRPRLFNTVNELFQKTSVCHILGPAGCGKTMLMRHLCIEMASQNDDYLPILLPLNTLNHFLDLEQPAYHLLDFITRWVQDRGEFNPHSLFEDALRKGKALILLDGLDELQAHYRFRVRNMINSFIEKYITTAESKGNRLIVTERGSQFFGLTPTFDDSQMFEVLDFDSQRIESLVERWTVFLKTVDTKRTITYREQYKINEFKRMIAEKPLYELTKNPFYLTLMTVTFHTRTPQEVFTNPAKSYVLHLFFKTILGLWNQQRSMDGSESPFLRMAPLHIRRMYSPQMATWLLSTLAWAMVGDKKDLTSTNIDKITAQNRLIRECQIQGFTPDRIGSQEGVASQVVNELFSRWKEAGFIIEFNEQGQLKVAFSHYLLFYWFLTFAFRHDIDSLRERIEEFVHNPGPINSEWVEPLAMALGAVGSIGEGNPKALRENVELALMLRPFQGRGVSADDSETLHRILPLGLDLCLQLLEEGGSYNSYIYVEQQIMDELRKFFEETEYAVLTNDLQPRIIQLLPRAAWAATIPRNPGDLEEWIERLNNQPHEVWRAEVDKIWRYQTDAQCFDQLFKAVDQHFNNYQNIPDWRDEYQKLYRRLVFGLRFTKEGSFEVIVDHLARIIGDSKYFDNIIIAMAIYALQDIYKRVVKDADQTLRTKIDKLLNDVNGKHYDNRYEITGSTTSKLIQSAADYPISTVIVKTDLQVLVNSQADALIGRDNFIFELQGVIENPQARPHEKAVAIIFLATIFRERVFKAGIEMLYPEGEHYGVLKALLQAASVRQKEDQHQNVEACQVYDFAAWAIRSIFLHKTDLSGLPLAPQGWKCF